MNTNQKHIKTNCNADRQQATVVTSEGIKVLGYDDIKLSDLVAMASGGSTPVHYDAFSEFHNDNPWVLPLLIKMAKNLMRKGVKKYSLRGLFHIIRYKYLLRTNDKSSSFGLNNNYSSYYARLIMKIEPTLKDFFSIRAQGSVL
jgi:hypothetical protein